MGEETRAEILMGIADDRWHYALRIDGRNARMCMMPAYCYGDHMLVSKSRQYGEEFGSDMRLRQVSSYRILNGMRVDDKKMVCCDPMPDSAVQAMQRTLEDIV